MANPALKNGYISIANELVEHLATINIPGGEMRIVWVIWRKTWGWSKGNRKKDWDWISLSQFQRFTGMKRANCVREIKSLVVKRILLKQNNSYKFNQNYEQWLVVKRIPPVVKRITELVVKRIPTKETNTKENNIGILIFQNSKSKKMFIKPDNISYDEDGNTINLPESKKEINKKQLQAEQFLKFYNANYKKMVGDDIPPWSKSAYLKQIYPILEKYDLEKLKKLLVEYFSSNDKYYEENNWAIWTFLNWKTLNRLN